MPRRPGKGGKSSPNRDAAAVASSSNSRSNTPLLSPRNADAEPDSSEYDDYDGYDDDVAGTRRKSERIAGQSFTVRGVVVGLLVGLVICFSNMYFGLQTGWVSTMTMPASL